ncbi:MULTISPECIES: Mov34/MPN/PAD-1 family protein [Hymenobacter]|uniref:Mov34/MPN/PAD-1 family protein n=1 Tax=Hymenobacter TaxID=89966 RepID=UPI00147EDC46|nr:MULTISPECIES: Mov34/MPN/PAD-1 family protein [Hymenobacter]
MIEAEFTLWLSESAYKAILLEAMRRMPCETGGILLGYWSTPQEAVITAIIGPGPKAVHRKRSFQPDSTYHEREIARHYEESGRTETYLGDWHTHPKAGAYMSSKDESTLRVLADYAPARLLTPIMMILGTDPPSLKAWIHTYRRKLLFKTSAFHTCKILHY